MHCKPFCPALGPRSIDLLDQPDPADFYLPLKSRNRRTYLSVSIIAYTIDPLVCFFYGRERELDTRTKVHVGLVPEGPYRGEMDWFTTPADTYRIDSKSCGTCHSERRPQDTRCVPPISEEIYTGSANWPSVGPEWVALLFGEALDKFGYVERPHSSS